MSDPSAGAVGRTLTRAEVVAASGCESVVDALVGVLRLRFGRAYAASPSNATAFQAIVLVVTDDSTTPLRTVEVLDADEDNWYEHDVCWGTESANPNPWKRARGLERVLARLEPTTNPSEEWLGSVVDGSPYHAAMVQVHLAARWDDLLTDGCTPETARTMLALTMPEDTLRRLTFPESGPPVLG